MKVEESEPQESLPSVVDSILSHLISLTIPDAYEEIEEGTEQAGNVSKEDSSLKKVDESALEENASNSNLQMLGCDDDDPKEETTPSSIKSTDKIGNSGASDSHHSNSPAPLQNFEDSRTRIAEDPETTSLSCTEEPILRDSINPSLKQRFPSSKISDDPSNEETVKQSRADYLKRFGKKVLPLPPAQEKD
ncbi:Oidioi.mRNA.OKI2018_I69.chr2.g6518.t1.cds [Oikopleura dioica]|uniref:Oidioi.mRNA.OKI2018_I69.chr2.g6518.t1.cds n=1 Tax=Oikopleura dioica TaxID=34765 RepID=A0ABN7T3Q5_OIKDI|nr:Oidioi.mRNA.OKI2018_I69.chr2.g6518.t1.cds [Oikopleura dioica]